MAHPGFARVPFFLLSSVFKPSLNNYEPNDIFLFKSAQPSSSFSETNEQQLIFIYKKKKKIPFGQKTATSTALVVASDTYLNLTEL